MSAKRKILPFEDEMKLIKDNVTKVLANVNRDFGAMKSVIQKSMEELNRLAVSGFEKLQEHDKILMQIKECNENAEQTLLNVLLAIRQNEYLQAWYPAQKGIPEMKITGKHPLQVPDIVKPEPEPKRRRR